MEPETLSQDIGDAQLPYLHWPGEGPVVVMLHATGFPPWLWHPVARELAGEYRVVAPCLSEHRDCDPGDGGLSWLVLARDLANFIHRLGISDPVIVGHSMGATVSCIAEALHGPFASRMFLVEPIFLPSAFYGVELTVDQHPLAARAMRRREGWSGEAEARKYLRGKELFANWDGEVFELYLRHGLTQGQNGALTLACSPAREASLFLGGMALDPWTILENISCPVLLVEGSKSENQAAIDLRRAASVIPNAELRVVEKAGHLAPMEKPYELLAMLREFLAAVPRGGEGIERGRL